MVFVPKPDLSVNVNTLTPTETPVRETPPKVTVRPVEIPTPSSQPTESPKRDYDRVLIMAAGDVVIQDQQLTAALQADGTYDFSMSFSPISSYVSQADLALANLEGVLPGEGNYSGSIKYGYPDALVTALKGAGFDMLTCANDHVFDFGEEGARRTAEQIRAQGLGFGGIALTEDEKHYSISEINGIKIAVTSFSYSFDGTLEVPTYMTVEYKTSAMVDVIKEAKADGAEFIIVQMHWGNEESESVANETKAVAQSLLDAGADVIFGTNPHIVQEVQRKKVTDENGKEREVFVAYSLGNLISSQRQGGRDCGIIAGVEILKDKQTGKITLGQTSYAPVWVQNKDIAGNSCYRVLMAGAYANMEASPSDISPIDFDRMKAVWTELTEKLGDIKAQPIRGTMQGSFAYSAAAVRVMRPILPRIRLHCSLMQASA